MFGVEAPVAPLSSREINDIVRGGPSEGEGYITVSMVSWTKSTMVHVHWHSHEEGHVCDCVVVVCWM